jgi:hypothetical protein
LVAVPSICINLGLKEGSFLPLILLTQCARSFTAYCGTKEDKGGILEKEYGKYEQSDGKLEQCFGISENMFPPVVSC